MKKLSLILLLFLLPLCLIPSTSAVYGDESPQSITSFVETLPDDVLYYPDSFITAVELADYGEISDESSSPDYILTHVKDGSAFNETTATDIEIWFEVDTTDGFEGFSYAHYMNVDSGTDVDLAAYDFDQDLWVKIDEPLPSSYAWMNGTIYDPDYWNTTHIAFSMYELSGNADLYWDYGEITIHRMTLADSNHYAEGFNDVSEWVSDGSWQATLSTDGDEGLLTYAGAGSYGRMEYTFGTDFDASGMYLEYRINSGIEDHRIVLYDTDAPASVYDSGWLTGTGTIKLYLGNSAESVDEVWLCIDNTQAGGSRWVTLDYLRISPANETGWQHDGSTTEGILEVSQYDDASSDGDIIHIVGDEASYNQVHFDIPDISQAHYPFFELRWKAEVGEELYIRIYDEDDNGFLHLTFDEDGTWQILRLNAQALVSSGDSYGKFVIYGDRNSNQEVYIDYIKFYSIANFSYWGVAVESDDFCYVESDSLVFTTDGYPEYILWGYDVPLTVDTNVYTVWNLTIADDDPTGALDYNINFYIPVDDPPTFNDETRGDLNRGTLTDFTFSVYISNTISAIKFIDTRDWQEIGEVEFVIPVGWDPTFIFGYDAFFIFLGLILIPVSTMYLVRGGREEASADKVFYFLIMFMIGFGLLVGGIMP